MAQDVPCVLVKLLLFGVLIGLRRKNVHCMLRGLRDRRARTQGADAGRCNGAGFAGHGLRAQQLVVLAWV